MLANKKQMEAFVANFRHGTRLTYKKGEYILRPGEAPTGVFYIESGIVKAYDITKYGEENLLIIRKENEIFPLIWGVTGQERHVIYQTLTPTVVWRISQKAFLEYIKNPVNALSPLLDLTMEMYRIHSERIMNLEYRTVRERLISFIITMGQRFGKVTPSGNIKVDLPLRQQDIASSINASRETTSRELSLLEKRGLIKTNPQYVIIKDEEKLKSYL